MCGAKAHIVYDPDAERPTYLSVTTAKVNDIAPAKAMPIEPGATYVFDLEYYDYGWWARPNEAGCRIVTRLKVDTPPTVVETRALPAGSSLTYDRVGYLPERMSFRRHNPMQDPMREIGVMLDDGRSLRVVTNDLDAPAQEIADLYKRRGASNSSSGGSNKPSRSSTSSADPRMPCGFRSPSPSSPTSCFA